MGQVYSRSGKIYRLQSWVGIVLLLAASSAFSLEPPKPKSRDARQLTLMVADFDGTLGHNVGNYRLRRVAQIEAVSPFFTGLSQLPEEISVPVHDFEGNVGPQIGKCIGKVDEKGRFIPSTSLDPVKLSNGETIIPGYYYFDLQTSLREFRPPVAGAQSHLVTSIEEKLKGKEPFLLDGFTVFSALMQPKFEDRAQGAVLTMRGHSAEEWQAAFDLLQRKLKLPKHEWPDEAFISLTHPQNYEFGFSKNKYLERAYDELSDRVMADTTTPHYLVMFENDREYLRQVDDLFKTLANRGVYSSPVVPVLVNLVEEEVLQHPDGHRWDWAPNREITKMSRVTIYWPGKIERSNDIGRVLELTLDMTPAETRKLMATKNPFLCSQRLLSETK